MRYAALQAGMATREAKAHERSAWLYADTGKWGLAGVAKCSADVAWVTALAALLAWAHA